jgi:hypothetical protein
MGKGILCSIDLDVVVKHQLIDQPSRKGMLCSSGLSEGKPLAILMMRGCGTSEFCLVLNSFARRKRDKSAIPEVWWK